MKKQIFALSLSLSIVGAICGCSQEDKGTVQRERKTSETGILDETSNSEEEQIRGDKKIKERDKDGINNSEIPIHFSEIVDNVEFDTVIEAPNVIAEEQKILSEMSIQKMNWELIKNKLFAGIEVADELQEDVKDRNGDITKAIYYTGSDEQFMSLYEEKFDFFTPLYLQISNAFSLEENSEKYSKDKQLSFMEREEALSNVLQTITSLGITIGENPYYNCYSLDYSTMQEEESFLDIQGNEDPSGYKESWGIEDECYYFSIWQTYEGVLIHSPYSQVINKMADWNAPIQVLYSKRGIEYIAVGNVFLFNGKEAQKDIKSFEEVAGAIKETYTMIISESIYRVEKAKLCYYPEKLSDGAYRTKLIWVVGLNEVSRDENVKGGEFQEAYDACTLEELY